MGEALLLASRLLLFAAGAGGAIAVLWAGARRRIGWMPAIAAALILLSFTPASEIPIDSPVVTFALLMPWFLGFPLLASTFPDGRFTPRWTIWLCGGSAAVLVADAALGDAPRQSAWWVAFPSAQLVLAVVAIVYRYRRSATTAEREAVRWVLLGTIATAAAFMLIQVTDGVIGTGDALAVAKANLAGVPLMAGLVIGAAWPRLWNVDAAFRAVLVALGAGWSLGGVFAATSGIAGSVGAAPTAASGWGAVAVGAAAYPLVRLSMRLATWVVHRDRLEPAAAVARLAEALDADDPRPVAQRVVDVAAEAVGSPAVGLQPAAAADAAAFDAAGGTGADAEAIERGEPFPVSFRGELLATLRALPRAGESELSRRDRAALAAIARHAGPALDGVRTLQQARAAQALLVGAREEERRRLRRELHDDLGPALSGLALGAAAIAKRAADGDPGVAEAARELQSDIREAVARSREISHGLRPPVLDDLGLEAAIRARLGADPDVRLDVGDLGDLPAAVDLAALRIVQEAVTNARRHAHASGCRVRLARDEDGLRIEVADDGVGMPRIAVPGLGLRSIRERAAELGGRARISRPSSGGTLVTVWLPIVSAVEAAS